MNKHSKHYPENASDATYNSTDTHEADFLTQHLLSQEQFDNLPEDEKKLYLEKVQKQRLDEQVNMTESQKAHIKTLKTLEEEYLLEEKRYFHKQSFNDPQSVIKFKPSFKQSIINFILLD